MISDQRYTFYEFFAGGGMAQAGLGPQWVCEFANDIDRKKCATYNKNWPNKIVCADVSDLDTLQLPGHADLAWASFPCQDLSLAGNRAGLGGSRSGAFWPFWQIIRDMAEQNRPANLIVLENVVGLLTANNGADFAVIAREFREAGYRCGALIIDAVTILPQSRPRLFIVGVKNSLALPDTAVRNDPHPIWHPEKLIASFAQLSPADQDNWIWWHIPAPVNRTSRFADLIEQNPESVQWNSEEKTTSILDMMSKVNREKVNLAQAKASLQNDVQIGAVYRRTRTENGKKTQRAEVRFDDVAGCLRTPSGGSSRQVLLVVSKNDIRSRLISSRETARLMGLPDSYLLPENYNEAYHLTGDGVAVPVVRLVAKYLLEPVIEHQSMRAAA